MKKIITEEELFHMRDPIARMVWKRWIDRGDATLIRSGKVCLEAQAPSTSISPGSIIGR